MGSLKGYIGSGSSPTSKALTGLGFRGEGLGFRVYGLGGEGFRV